MAEPQIRAWKLWLPAAIILLIVIGIWLPTGFRHNGNIEVWLWSEEPSFMVPIDLDVLFLNTTTRHSLRPWLAHIHQFATALTPGSFVGLNLIHITLLAGKGILLFLILARLTRRYALAFVAGLLFVLYTSDTASFSLRMTHIHAAAYFYLMALGLLIVVYDTHRRWLQSVLLILIALIQGYSLLVYELAYPLIFVTPLLLIWLNRGIDRRVVVLSAVWLFIPSLLFVRFVLGFLADSASSSDNLFQEILLGQANARMERYGGRINFYLALLGQAFARNTFSSWAEVIDNALKGGLPTAWWLIAAAGGLSAGVVSWFLWGQQQLRMRWRSIALFTGLGLVVIFLGFVMYIPAGYTTTDRVYLISAAGGGMFIAGLMLAVARLLPAHRLVFSVLASVIVTTGFIGSLMQRQHYVDEALAQQHVIAGIAEQMPQIGDIETVVIFDETDTLVGSGKVFVDSRRLRQALRMLYEDNELNVRLCRPYDSTRISVFLPPEICEPGPETIAIPHPVSYEHVAAFLHTIEGNLLLLDEIPTYYTFGETIDDYNPRSHICQDCDPPPRVYTLLSDWPLEGALQPPEQWPRENPALTEIRDEFNTSVMGAGWSFGTRIGSAIYLRFGYPKSSYHVNLAPGEYILTLRLIGPDDAWQRLQIEHNGKSLKLDVYDSGVVWADLDIVEEQEAVLTFRLDDQDNDPTTWSNDDRIGINWLQILRR